MSVSVKWRGGKLAKEAAHAGGVGLMLAAEYALENMNRIVPHDGGTLMRSGTVCADDYPDGNGVYRQAESGRDMSHAFPGTPKTGVVWISYNTPYAVRLHEHPEYQFQGGRQGRWVESTMQAEQDAMLGIIADALRGALK